MIHCAARIQKPQIKRDEVEPPSFTRIVPPGGSPSKPPLDPNRPPSGSKLAPLPPAGATDRSHGHRPALGLTRRRSSGTNPDASATDSGAVRPSSTQSTSSLTGATTRGPRLAPLPEGARESAQRQPLRVDELDRDAATQQRRRPPNTSSNNQYAPMQAERFGGSFDAQSSSSASVGGESMDTPRRVRSGPQGVREPLLGPEDVAGEARSFSATVNQRMNTPRSSGYTFTRSLIIHNSMPHNSAVGSCVR